MLLERVVPGYSYLCQAKFLGYRMGIHTYVDSKVSIILNVSQNLLGSTCITTVLQEVR